MTIAISLKVNDGVVLASDSATTFMGRLPPNEAPQILNIYNNANKIFNLRKGTPVGAITWGAGSIGPASISTIAKDFRNEMWGEEPETLNPAKYSVLEVAQKFREYFLVKYQGAFSEWPQKPELGFIVAGYGSDAELAEEFRIDFLNGECTEPTAVRTKDESGVTWSGEPEAITRMLMGFGTNMPLVLHDVFGVSNDQLPFAMNALQDALAMPFVLPPMPIQDAIDLAEFLVDATIKFKRFSIGGPTVGGPIEIAAITKHEGFKWVKRKHYYSSALNP